MIRLIYFLLALLVIGCVQQANTTHPKDDVAPIDSASAATNDGQENTVLSDLVSTDTAQTDSVLTDSALTDSSMFDSNSANLQCSDLYKDREIRPAYFYKDTLETILSSRSVKTFLSEDKKEIVQYDMQGDTILYYTTKANVIISNHNQVDKSDTIIITRSLLNKEINISDIVEFNIASIHYKFEKGDTICFSIGLFILESDIGYFCKYYHTAENDYIEVELADMNDSEEE